MDNIQITPVKFPFEKFTISINPSNPGNDLYTQITNMTAQTQFKLIYKGKVIDRQIPISHQIPPQSTLIMIHQAQTKPQPQFAQPGIASSPLQMLIEMGFQRNLASTALAQVGGGYGALQNAIDWINRNQAQIESVKQFIHYPQQKPVKPVRRPPKRLPSQVQYQQQAQQIKRTQKEISYGYSWGVGHSGQLGLGDTFSTKFPMNIRGLAGIQLKAISCGTHHTCAISINGQLFAWGKYVVPLSHPRKYGNKTSPSKFKEVQHIKFTDIAAGSAHSLALDMFGQIYSWGEGAYGCLGHSSESDEYFPKKIDKLEIFTIVKLAAAGNHSVVLTKEGQVLTWGRNNSGQLGTGEFSNRNQPGFSLFAEEIEKVACGLWHTIAVSQKGEIFRCGSGLARPQKLQVEDFLGFSKLACGGTFSLILSNSGDLYKVEQPEENTGIRISCENFQGIKQISCGGTFSILLLDDGNILAVGNNRQGQLGLGDYKNRDEWSPVIQLSGLSVDLISCGSTHCVAIVKIDNLRRDLASLIGNDLWKDVELVSKDRTHISAHRFLLKNAENRIEFEQTLSGDFSVPLTENSTKVLLAYLYSGQLVFCPYQLSLKEILQLKNFCVGKNLLPLVQQLGQYQNDLVQLKQHKKQRKVFKTRNTVSEMKKELMERQARYQASLKAEREQLEDRQEDLLMDLDQEQEEYEQRKEEIAVISTEERRKKMLEAFARREQTPIVIDDSHLIREESPPPVQEVKIPQIDPSEAERKRQERLEALSRRLN